MTDNQSTLLKDYPPLLTVKQVAKIFQVTPLTIKRWGKKGILPPIRINSRGDRRYTKEQVLWLIGQRQNDNIQPSVNKKLYEVDRAAEPPEKVELDVLPEQRGSAQTEEEDISDQIETPPEQKSRYAF